MNLRLFCTVLLILISANVANAAFANYYPSYNEISLFNGSADKPVDMAWLYSQIQNDEVLSHKGTTYYLNATLRLYDDSKLDICPPACTKLVMNNSGKIYYAGSYNISNIEIVGGQEIGTWDTFHDIYIHNAGGIRLDSIDQDVYNISIDNSGTGLNMRNSHDIKIYNITVNNTDIYGIHCDNCNNTEIYNVSITDAGDHTNPQTGHYAIAFEDHSTNSSAHDIYVDGSGWSSMQISYNTYNISYYNITVRHSGHNGLDIHGGSNHHINNMTVYDSNIGHDDGNNFLICFAPNCSLTNIYSYNASPGRSMLVSEDADNFYLGNYYSEGGSQGFCSYYINNITIINMTSWNNVHGIALTSLSNVKTTNATIIDTNLTGNTQLDLWVEDAENIKLLNVNYLTNLYGNSGIETVFYYYPDIYVKNSTGFFIPNATVVFTNPLDPNFSSVNGYGKKKMTFWTASNGRTCLPNTNRENSPAIAKKYINSTMMYDDLYSTADIITPDGYTVYLTGIAPDSSWYRKDPNTPTYTITAIIPEKSSKGPHIVGFAPSTNNLKPGEEKNFRVWIDGNLAEMNWSIDGKNVSQGSLNYTCSVTESNKTVEFRGVDANGNVVSHVWNLWDSPDENILGDGSGDQQNSIIEFFPNNTADTKSITEFVTFKVDYSVPLITNWYINEKLV